jgi:hypothetical protein
VVYDDRLRLLRLELQLLLDFSLYALRSLLYNRLNDGEKKSD